jgi:hypothetical protein
MNEPRFSPARSAAIRDELVRIVQAGGRAGRFRKALAGVGLVVAGALVGAGSFAATAEVWSPQPHFPETSPVIEPTSNPGVSAPDGHLPGQPIVSLLGQVTSFEVDGEERIIQLEPPDGATHVRVSVTCTAPGLTAWGFDAGGNNPRSECGPADVGPEWTPGWMDFDLRDEAAYPQHDLFYVQPSSGAASIVTVQYLSLIETAWEVNAAGETCGVSKPGFGEPDLVAVVALTTSGDYVDGFARRAQILFPFPGQHEPTSPADAMEQQEHYDQLYPTGIDIPVYECDGVTQVGTFHVG